MRERAAFGLQADEAWVRAVARNPNARTDLIGIPMLPVEELEFQARQEKLLGTARVVQGYTDEHADQVAGLFIDQDHRLVVVLVTADVETHRAAIDALLPDGAPVDVRLARYTRAELETLLERVVNDSAWFKAIGAAFVEASLDEMQNRVVLEISSANAAAPGLIAAHFGAGPDALQSQLRRHGDPAPAARHRPWPVSYGRRIAAERTMTRWRWRWASDQPARAAGDCGSSEMPSRRGPRRQLRAPVHCGWLDDHGQRAGGNRVGGRRHRPCRRPARPGGRRGDRPRPLRPARQRSRCDHVLDRLAAHRARAAHRPADGIIASECALPRDAEHVRDLSLGWGALSPSRRSRVVGAGRVNGPRDVRFATRITRWRPCSISSSQRAARYGEKNALGLRRDDGTTFHWSYARGPAAGASRGVAPRALGLEPGDRVLTWSPSTPALPAAYFGSMYARLIYVPLDSRMSTDAIQNIVEASGAKHLLLGTGRDAPDPREVGPRAVPHHDGRVAVRGPGRRLPGRLGGAGRGVAAPDTRRGVRARLHVRHHRQPEGRDARPRQPARGRAVVPRGHQADGAPDRLAAPAVAQPRADRVPVLRDGRRRGHPVRPEPQPAGHLRQPPRAPGHDDAARAPGARPVLERDRARGRAAGQGGSSSSGSGRSRAGCPTPPAASCSGASTPSSAAASACSRPPARSCRPRSSRPGRTWA